MKAILPATVLPALFLAACQGPPNEASGGNVSVDNSTAMDNMGSSMAPGNRGLGNDQNAVPASAQTSTDAATYLAQAGAGDMFEIESSKAVLDKTKDTKVREFAQMMIKQHQESTANVKAAASEAKLTVVPPVLAANQKSMLDEIKAAPAATVDAVYLQHQKTAHDAALALHQNYAAAGDTPALKKAANEIATVVKQHIAHLAEITVK